MKEQKKLNNNNKQNNSQTIWVVYEGAMKAHHHVTVYGGSG